MPLSVLHPGTKRALKYIHNPPKHRVHSTRGYATDICLIVGNDSHLRLALFAKKTSLGCVDTCPISREVLNIGSQV